MRRWYDDNTLRELYTSNDIFRDHKGSLVNMLNKNQGKLSFFCPMMRRDTVVGNDANRALIDLQCESNYNLITIQDISRSSNIRDFENRIQTSRERVERISSRQLGFGVAIHIGNPDWSLFQSKVDAIIDGGFESIVLKGASHNAFYGNYHYLTNPRVSDKNILIHVSGIDRKYRDNGTTSLMHYLQTFGIDSFSIKMPVGRDPEMNSREPHEITRYDRNTLGHLSPTDHTTIHGDQLNCPGCPICRGYNIESQYMVGNQHGILTTVLNAHESIASHNEFESSRSFVTSNEFDDYAHNKRYLAMMNMGIRQSSLSDF